MTSKSLIKIVEGAAAWLFTTSNEPETYLGDVYTPRICGVGAIVDSVQVNKNTLEVTFPLIDDLAQHFLQSPVDFAAKFWLYSKDEAGTFATEWRGTLTKTVPDDSKIVLTFNSIFSSNRRVGARRPYQRACPHTLYGPACGLVYTDKRIAATVTAIAADGLTLTIPGAAALPDGRLNAGVVEMPDGTKRYVISHVGSTVKIVRVSPSLNAAFIAANPVNVYIAPGCSQNTTWCEEVFNNLANHGGFPFIPLQNPTASSIQ